MFKLLKIKLNKSARGVVKYREQLLELKKTQRSRKETYFKTKPKLIRPLKKRLKILIKRRILKLRNFGRS